jgi:ATP-dependent protease ClpP protease subunit
MLIHQLSSNLWGKYSEIEDEKKNLDLMMETIRNVYTEYTKVPIEELDEILKHDLMWDAKTCLKYNLVDRIV